jgi:hypothetical protein
MDPISRNSPTPAVREAEIFFLRYDPRAFIHRSF